MVSRAQVLSSLPFVTAQCALYNHPEELQEVLATGTTRERAGLGAARRRRRPMLIERSRVLCVPRRRGRCRSSQ
eukprot:scaffold1651_cov297-Prasinococcus_capsulatus_cf.AAC.2